MKRSAGIFLALFILAGSSRGGPLPVMSHLDLRMRVEPARGTFSCEALLTIRNTTDAPVTELPFVLYRLVTVSGIRDETGAPLPFSQGVAAFDDEPTLQANVILARLPAPLPPGDSVALEMAYGGHLLGYTEVMAYVHDRIDEEYSLFRPDAFAFPALALPSFSSVYGSIDDLFTYRLSVTVPAGYTVATGGLPTGRTAADSAVTFGFTSRIPGWRFDIAVAQFTIIDDRSEGLTVYGLPADEAGAKSVLLGSQRAIDYYSSRFGKPESFQGYTIIEIPEGWGSQAGDYYFLQTAAAFRDSSHMGEVYHEIAHSWNARPSPSVRRCRYFDEAFASYFQALAVGEFQGDTAFLRLMEQYRERFSLSAARDEAVSSTPISRYGEKELGRHSYTKGAWSLYVLEQLVGAKAFTEIVVALRERSPASGADFDSFRRTAEEISGLDLGKFFDEWIFGSESSRLLMESVPIALIVARLR